MLQPPGGQQPEAGNVCININLKNYKDFQLDGAQGRARIMAENSRRCANNSVAYPRGGKVHRAPGNHIIR